MTECDEIADGLPLIMIGRRITMDEAREMIRQSFPDETEPIIDAIADRWRDRVNAHFDAGAARLLRAIINLIDKEDPPQ